MKTKSTLWIVVVSMLLTACSGSDNSSDGYGSFEAEDCLLSAELPGKIIAFDVSEGDKVDSGKVLMVIDTIPLYLKKQQLESSQKAIGSKVSGIVAQIAVLEKQKEQIEIEIKRMEKLVASQSVPSKQLDDLRNQSEVLKKQIESVRTQNAPVMYELESLGFQVKQLDDQIFRSVIHAPCNATVVEKYAEAYEYVSPGKGVCKIAGMQFMYLRAYVDETSLSKIKTGTTVRVLFDENDAIAELPGTVTWISPEAEFTPKTIQTRDERASLVYAVKIKVANDGRIKIGMPGEFVIAK